MKEKKMFQPKLFVLLPQKWIATVPVDLIRISLFMLQKRTKKKFPHTSILQLFFEDSDFCRFYISHAGIP